LSTEINIYLKATDYASNVVTDVASKLSGSMAKIDDVNRNVKKSTENVTVSSKQMGLAFNNVATSGFALYNAIDRVMDMQVQVDRANLQVKVSLNSVEDAQKRYNATVEKFGVESEQAQSASKDLQLAQERYQVACERASMIQGNLNEAMFQSALTVIPSLITMITSVSTLTHGWTAVTQGVSSALNFLAANPIILVVAGIAALIAGLIWAYQNCEPFRNAINAIASVLRGAFFAAIDAVRGALEWVWKNVLVPVGSFIATTFVAAWNDMVAIWRNYVLPAIDAVRSGVQWLWNNVLVPFGQFLSTVFQAYWTALSTIFNVVILPALTAVQNAFSWLWHNVLDPLGAFLGGALLAAWNALANGISWAYNNVLKPVFDALSWVWNNILKPIADVIGAIVGAVTGFLGGGGTPSNQNPNVGGHLQHGGIVTRPTLTWVGEAGPEAVIPLNNGRDILERIIPFAQEGRAVGGDVYINLTVSGSMDRPTAEYTARLIEEKLRNVLVEASSTSGGSTHKRIRVLH